MSYKPSRLHPLKGETYVAIGKNITGIQTSFHSPKRNTPITNYLAYKYRIMAVLKVKTDIITSITVSPIFIVSFYVTV
jgi:hypothetical protein